MYVYSIMCRLFRFVATNHKKLCMMAPPTRHFTSVQYDLDDLDLRCCGSDHQKLHTTNPWDWSHQACTVLFSRLGPRDGGCAEFYIIPAEASSHSYCTGNNTNSNRYISCTCKPCLVNKLWLSTTKHSYGLGNISVVSKLMLLWLGYIGTVTDFDRCSTLMSARFKVVPNCLGLTRRWSIKLQHIKIKSHVTLRVTRIINHLIILWLYHSSYRAM